MATYDNQWIIRYVDGELSTEESGAFEAAMHTDPQLAAQVAEYRELKAVLQERLPEDPTREALIQRTTQLNTKYFEPGTSRRPASRVRMLRWLAPVAAAACILAATVLLWPSDYNHKLDQLGQTEMIGITERGVQTDSLLQEAAVYFNSKQFDKALPLLNGAVVADTSSQLALFYLGIAAWHTGDTALARNSLTQVYDRGSVMKNEAAFYMALTYAKEKNKTLALEWLQKIPEMAPEHLKANELENLIK
ncbi:MAG TPA: tetratricopeptide repeat protein [Puia sp.]|nr:tetratricopeptide repeat protein [Puia sp.]